MLSDVTRTVSAILPPKAPLDLNHDLLNPAVPHPDQRLGLGHAVNKTVQHVVRESMKHVVNETVIHEAPKVGNGTFLHALVNGTKM